jgi:TonB family protein
MPKKSQQGQKDFFVNQEELFSSATPDGSTDKKVNGVVAFDAWDGVLRTAVGNASDNISYSVISDALAAEQVQRLKSYKILSTQESLGKFGVIEQQGLKIETLPRSLAVYWSFQPQVGDKPCIVISIEANSTKCALIINGRLVEQREDSFELSLKGIWRNYVEGNALFKRWLEAYKERDANIEDQIFKGFLSALETGKIAQAGPISIIPPIDLSGSLNAFRNLFRTLDQHQIAETVILSNWAAAPFNLAELLSLDYKTVLVAERDKIFYEAVKGLVIYSLSAPKPGKPPALKLLHQALTFTKIPQGESAQSIFKIQNVGGGILKAQIKSQSAWMKVLPDMASCEAGKEQTIIVEIDTGELAGEQSYSGEIEIEWSSGNSIETIKLPVSVVTVNPKSVVTVNPKPAVIEPLPRKATSPPPPPQPAPPVEVKAAQSRPRNVTAEVIQPSVPVADKVVVKRPTPEVLPVVVEPSVNPLSILVTIAIVAIIVIVIALFFWLKRQPIDNDKVNLNQGNVNEASQSSSSPLQTQNIPADVPTDTAPTNTAPTSAAPTPTVAPQTTDPTNSNIAKQTTPDANLNPPNNVNGVTLATQTPTPTQPVGPSPQELARVHQRNADQLLQQGQIDQALEEVNSGLSLDPTNQSLGNMRAKLERAKNALNRQNQLATETPEAPRLSPLPQRSPTPLPTPLTVVNRKAELLSSPSPLYPSNADSPRKSATVWVEVTIDERGNVSSARPFQGPSQFYQAAVTAALRSRFRPALRNGQPVGDKQPISIMFHP